MIILLNLLSIQSTEFMVMSIASDYFWISNVAIAA